jgi:hypothetical protein
MLAALTRRTVLSVMNTVEPSFTRFDSEFVSSSVA